MFSDAPVFDVDLNSVRDGNRITTLLDHAATPLVQQVAMGTWVWVRDERGVSYPAIVKQVEGRRVRLKIDWTANPRLSFDKSADATFGTLVPAGVPSGID